MTRPVRILVVTVGLMAAGAVFGAVAGVIAFGVAEVLTEGPRSALRAAASIALIGAYFGAPLGAILAPAAAWSALRNVPFGRMFVWSVAATVIGGVIGWVIGPGEAPMGEALFGAFGGFCVATFLLWSAAQRRGLRLG